MDRARAINRSGIDKVGVMGVSGELGGFCWLLDLSYREGGVSDDLEMGSWLAEQ